MDTTRDGIVKTLEALQEVNSVEVAASKGEKTIYITYGSVRSLGFRFIWSIDHFIGYALDNEGKSSQALVSLWTPLEAIQFTSAYQTLIMLRAGRK